MATPVCPPWAPDTSALVAGMYWLYACWNPQPQAHTTLLHARYAYANAFYGLLLNFHLLSRSMYVCVDGCGNEALIDIYRIMFFPTKTITPLNCYSITPKPFIFFFSKNAIRDSLVNADLICNVIISFIYDVSKLFILIFIS